MSPRLALALVLVAARVALPLLLVHPAWGYHRDELLYFAMGDHLDLFRMQFPPLIALLARASTAAFGDAVWSARVPAALGGGAVLAVQLALATRLGAGRWALGAIALANLAGPVWVRPSVLFQPVVFDQAWCLVAVAGAVLAAEERAPRWWLLTGLGLGLGGLTKFSAGFYAAAIAIATLLVPALRAQLRTRWPWLAAPLALGLALPSLSGQVMHGWPFLAQAQVLRGSQLDRVSPAAFLGGQPLLLGAGAVLAVAGVAAARRAGDGARAALAFAAALLALLLVLRGKAYYGAPAWPPLLVTGAVALERWTAARRRALRWAVPALLATGAAVLLPLGIPMLAPVPMAAYAARLGVTEAVRTNMGETLALPQDYADMLGWEELAHAVGDVYRALPEAERAQVLVGAGNYGEAGALARYRHRHGYPYPVSTAGDFHAWGPGDRSGDVAILVDAPHGRDDLEQVWTTVTEVRVLANPMGVPEERDVRVWVARGLRRPLRELWPSIGPEW